MNHEHEFDFEAYFQRRFRPYKRKGMPQRPGTFTVSEQRLITDLVYDFTSGHKIDNGIIKPIRSLKKGKGKRVPTKLATSIIKDAINNSPVLVKDARGYFLLGEARVKFNDLWQLETDE